MASRAKLPPAPGQFTGAKANQTLYVSNLPDKLQKADLRRNLYLLFTVYGPVIDIIALKTSKMRGQAHIVYANTQCSSAALRALSGTDFFGKAMKIEYARTESDTIAKITGTFKIPTLASAATTNADGAPISELQKSIFNAPPAAAGSALPPATAGKEKEGPHGVKRTRDEDESMADEEEDEGSAMEESDSD